MTGRLYLLQTQLSVDFDVNYFLHCPGKPIWMCFCVFLSSLIWFLGIEYSSPGNFASLHLKKLSRLELLQHCRVLTSYCFLRNLTTIVAVSVIVAKIYRVVHRLAFCTGVKLCDDMTRNLTPRRILISCCMDLY